MSHQVFRVRGGNVLHVIHETSTGANRTRDVFTLCSTEARDGERDKGTPTCKRCLEMDDPFALSDAERNMLSRIFVGDPSIRVDMYGGRAITSLHRKDLVDKDLGLTRRGRVIALDWTEGTMPAADGAGVVHRRRALSCGSLCFEVKVLAGFEHMTVERYERLRRVKTHVTCVRCAAIPL